jgi:hypothetical protein
MDNVISERDGPDAPSISEDANVFTAPTDRASPFLPSPQTVAEVLW